MTKATILLSSFSSRTEKTAQTCGITEYLPPTAIRNEKLTFDFAPLFVADSLLMDTKSFHALSQSDEGKMPDFFEQVRVLREEGLIDLVDFNNLSEAELARIKAHTDKEAPDHDRWIPAIEKAINGWELMRSSYSLAYSIDKEEEAMIPFIVNDTLAILGLDQTMDSAELVKRAVKTKSKKAVAG